MIIADKITHFMGSNVEIYSKPISEAGEAIARKNHTEDLMYLKFELLHANTNRNKDEFLKDELKAAYQTLVDKPINWEHRPNEIIGHVYSADYVEYKPEAEASSPVDTKTDVVVCEGVVYKYKIPTRAMEIQRRYAEKKLFYSMETYFEKAKCSECGKEFEDSIDYCEHLTTRFERGSTARRQLIGLLFGGAGCVKNPADDARGLIVASQRTNSIISLIDILGDRFTVEDYFEYIKKQ